MTNKLERVWCREFRAVLKIGNYFMGCRMPDGSDQGHPQVSFL